jgi:hypothetical protein
MHKRLWSVCTGLCGLATLMLAANPGSAQTQEIKAKPALYSYVANWQFPPPRLHRLATPVGVVNEFGSA